MQFHEVFFCLNFLKFYGPLLTRKCNFHLFRIYKFTSYIFCTLPNSFFRMLGQNHRSSLSILHGWLEHFRLYSGDRQHRWHRYGRLDGGLSGIPDTSASSTGLSYWSHLKAHQSCQRHSEVTLCSNRLTTGLVQYWSLVRYELYVE